MTQVERSPMSETGPSAELGAAPVYRVTVSLPTQAIAVYGKSQQFEAGMTLEADILQDRRTLIEWVLDPLLSAAKGRAR